MTVSLDDAEERALPARTSCLVFAVACTVLVACSAPPRPPPPACTPSPAAGSIVAIEGVPRRVQVPSCMRVPDAVEARLADENANLTVAAWERDSASPELDSYVTFTAPRAGRYELHLRYQPSLTQLQLPVVAAVNRLDAGATTRALPRPYEKVETLAPGVDLALGGGFLHLIVDGGVTDQRLVIDFARAGDTVWTSGIIGISRYTVDAGALVLRDTIDCVPAGRVFAISSTVAYAACGYGVDRIYDFNGSLFRTSAVGTAPTSPWIVAHLPPWAVFSTGRVACKWDLADVGGCSFSSLDYALPPAQDHRGLWLPSSGNFAHRTFHPDGGESDALLSLSTVVFGLDGGTRGEPLFRVPGLDAVFTPVERNGEVEFHAWPASPPPVEATRDWVRAQNDAGLQWFYPR
jgi:hypothetical protein